MDPLACLSQSFTLLNIDLSKTLDSHLASFCIGHTEHIIGLNSSINTAVARNWFSKRLDFLLWILRWNTVKSGDGFCLRLWSDNLLSSCNKRLSIVFLSFEMSFLFFKCFSWRLISIECILFGSENWLLKIINISDII